MMRILFVCLGNICRSPLGEGLLRHLADEAGIGVRLTIDSAGTGAWHIGDPPDRRSIATGQRHGFDISNQRARRVVSGDFDRFDLLLAMDRSTLSALRAVAPVGGLGKAELFMKKTLGRDEDVPDPYYDGDDGFEAVYTMLFAGCSALTAMLEARGS